MSWRPPRSSSPCSTGTRRSSRPASGSRTATAATWCSRSSPSARAGVAVPRPRAPERVRAGRDGRTPRSCAPTSCRRRRRSATSTADGLRTNVLPPARARHAATAASTRPSRTCTRSGRRSSPGGSSRADGSRRWSGRAATCPADVAAATGSASGCTPRAHGVWLEGYDAGVSFRIAHDPETDTTYTVVSNTSEGAWPVVRLLGAGQAG